MATDLVQPIVAMQLQLHTAVTTSGGRQRRAKTQGHAALLDSNSNGNLVRGALFLQHDTLLHSFRVGSQALASPANI